MRSPQPPYHSFDRVAGIYESTRSVPSESLAQASRLILNDCSLPDETPFLDAGVGTGRFARHLAAAGVRVTGIDISNAMLREAAMRSAALNLVCGDLRHMPLKSGSHGGALVIHILHLIAGWREVLGEIRRVLAPGSPLYLGAERPRVVRPRTIYFQRMEELGWQRPALGAGAVTEALEWLATTGAEVEQIDEDALAWQTASVFGNELEALRTQAYSQTWHLTPEENAALMADVESRLASEGLTHASVETYPAGLLLWRIRWPD